jgi:hypothetical protein
LDGDSGLTEGEKHELPDRRCTAVPKVFRGQSFAMVAGEDVTITDMEGGYFGKQVILRCNGSRRIAHNGNIVLKSTDGQRDGRTPADGTIIRLVSNGTQWQEM